MYEIKNKSITKLFLYIILFVFLFFPNLQSAVERTRENNRLVIKAKSSAKAIQHLSENLGVSRHELLEICIFIETFLPNYIRKKEYYLSEKVTGLACAIEYDPVTQYRFIHLGAKKVPRVGIGSKKVVTKSILYDQKHPEIVARCDQTISIAHEKRVTLALQGLPGVVVARAFTSRIENGKRYNSMFLKLYSPGSFSKVLENPQEFRLTLREKMKIALNILKGLEGMQRKHIIHKDMGDCNYLVNITKPKKNGRREVDVVIADLGSSVLMRYANGVKAQGHSAYAAPEGIFSKALTGKDYYKTDIYAVGCVLYYLLHEQKPVWLSPVHIKGPHPAEWRHRKLVSLITQETEGRRAELSQKAADQELMTAEEQFESLILQMIDINPSKRGSSRELREKMEAILELRACNAKSK